VKRAIVSVSDKKGVVDFAKGLASLGYEILSTGGTAKALREAGVKVTDVAAYTGSPEILDGRRSILKSTGDCSADGTTPSMPQRWPSRASRPLTSWP